MRAEPLLWPGNCAQLFADEGAYAHFFFARHNVPDNHHRSACMTWHSKMATFLSLNSSEKPCLLQRHTRLLRANTGASSSRLYVHTDGERREPTLYRYAYTYDNENQSNFVIKPRRLASSRQPKGGRSLKGATADANTNVQEKEINTIKIKHKVTSMKYQPRKSTHGNEDVS